MRGKENRLKLMLRRSLLRKLRKERLPGGKNQVLLLCGASFIVNEDLPPSPPRAPISEQRKSTKTAGEDEAEKTAEAEKPEVEKPVEVVVETQKVVNPETAKVESTHSKSPKVMARDPEKGKFAQEDPVTIFPTSASAPVNVERSPAGDQGASSYDEENDPLRPDETLGDHYYTTYSEKKESEIHTTVWNLKKGDTFSNWQVCRDWLQGTFPLAEIKFQEDRAQEQAYHAYLEEVARKAEAEATLLSKERKNWWEICETDNNEKIGLRNIINNLKVEVERLKKQDAEIEKLKQEKAEAEAARDEARSHWERSEQRKVRTCATLALKEKEIDELTALLSEQEQLKVELESSKKDLQFERVERAETSRRLSATEEKLEGSETARVTAESQIEPLKNDMLWLKESGIISISVANSVLNADELDEMVAYLLVAARNDGYAQGYAECSQHVVTALKVDWDTSRSATYGVNT
ncbi:myosin-3-like [Helianthus annuus]|uniref:myosin-3-like n=1 Tax=Helianthus annuus TaxID=4232 RepID=UPI000B902732|nr:myosin-3-like [Helianthus annuus]